MLTDTRSGLVVVAACAAWLALVATALAQPASSATDAGLLPLIPPDAVLFVERRGHEAVRPAFLDSNFGRMATDEAIHQFVHDSRRRIGRMIVAKALHLTDEQEIEHHRKLLHEFLKPFWHKPAAMFVVLDPASGEGLSQGIFCQPGREYGLSAREALAGLMAAAGKRIKGRQEFTHTTGLFRWQGTVKTDEPLALPDDPKARAKALKGRDLFMVSRSMSLLAVATDLTAAEALEKAVGRAAKDENPGVKRVLAKTAMKDWAFRWYFDMRALKKMTKAAGDAEAVATISRMLGLGAVGGLGGTGGYVENVYARRTYVDAPNARTGLARLLKQGGSYRKAMSMAPSGTVIRLAGELDPAEFRRMLRAAVTPVPATGPAATQPAARSGRGRSGPSQKTRARVEQICLLAEASTGHAGVFVCDLQGVMMAGGPPVGMVVGLKDRAKAVRAIDGLVKLAGPAPEGVPPGAMPPGAVPGMAMPAEYRKIPIRYAGRTMRFAVMKDRVVIALGDGAVKAAIDAAIDDTGGFEPDSKAQKLAESLGNGSGIFQVDLGAVAKALWPMAIQMAQMEEMAFPFTSLPSTNKMVRMLGPEIAVFEPTDGGLMIRSRGTVPFATKMFFLYPVMGILIVGF